jgi:hypothetical protein
MDCASALQAAALAAVSRLGPEHPPKTIASAIAMLGK